MIEDLLSRNVNGTVRGSEAFSARGTCRFAEADTRSSTMEALMTAAKGNFHPAITVCDGVYTPQEDSHLLCSEIAIHPAVEGGRVLDLRAGSGIAGIEAARCGADEVIAYNISHRAVECAATNARTHDVDVDVRSGTLADAAETGSFDMIVCNPPPVTMCEARRRC